MSLDRLVWIDGEIRSGDDARLSVFDRGARDGEGLFETIRVLQGTPSRWTRHLERLVVSAAELGFPVPPAPRTLRSGLSALLEATGLTEAAARITVTRGIPSGGGGRRTRTGSWIEIEPIAARLWRGTRAGGARLVVSRRAFEPGPLGRHKTTSRLAYHLAREEARAARADEALLVSGAGLVLEGSVSNVFVARDERVFTPPLSLGILPGIARAAVLQLCHALGIESIERRLTRPDLDEADEIFVTNVLQGVVPIADLDGRSFERRPIGSRLAAAYHEAVVSEIDAERGVMPPTVA